MPDWLLVAAGGAVGAVARFQLPGWLGLGGPGVAGGKFPWATLAVNLLGCLLIGLLAGAVQRGGGVWPAGSRAFLLTGVLGGFTTFSSFSWEAVLLLQAGALASALAYVLVSVAGGLLLAWGGFCLLH